MAAQRRECKLTRTQDTPRLPLKSMMPNPPQDPSKPDPLIVEDATCTFCGCLCDDISLSIDGDRIVGAAECVQPRRVLVHEPPCYDRPACLVEGQPATLEEGIERAARILLDARYPIIFGLSETTSEAQRLAVAIADWIGGCIDSTSDLDDGASTIAFQEVGEVTCTLGEVKNRGDLIIFWGSDPAETHPRYFERYSLEPEGTFVPRGREDRYCVVVDRSQDRERGGGRSVHPNQAAERISRRSGPCVHWPKGSSWRPRRSRRETGVPLTTWQALMDRMRRRSTA